MSLKKDFLSRRLFLKMLGTCTVSITMSPIPTKASPLLSAGAFWRNRNQAPLWVTQVIIKAAVAGGSGEMRTTQVVAKAAAVGGVGEMRTTQVVVKVAIRP